MTLKNKTIVLTGGTHGIGAATAIALAKLGANIALVARHAEDNKTMDMIRDAGVDSIQLTADLSKAEACQEVIEKTVMHFGALHGLIHCAGTAAPGGLLTGAENVWYQAFDVHIHAVFHLCKAAVPYMKRGKEGTIILISSAAGLRGVKNALAYAVVKGALPQFARALAFELSDDNIRVNCVSPGIIRTRFQDYLTEEQINNNVNNRIPLHKEGSPEDVAAVITMLVQNPFITGENVVIDGGMTMRIV